MQKDTKNAQNNKPGPLHGARGYTWNDFTNDPGELSPLMDEDILLANFDPGEPPAYLNEEIPLHVYSDHIAPTIETSQAMPEHEPSNPMGDSDFNDMALRLGDPAVRLKILAARQVKPKPESQAAPSDAWPNIKPCNHTVTSDPFPVTDLPTALLEAATEVARFVKTDVASPVTVGLSVVATAIGKKAKIIEKNGLAHYPALFFTIIADSGERKSPVYKLMANPLEEWSVLQQAEYKKKIERIKAENDMVEAQLITLKRKATRANELDRETMIQQIARESAKRKTLPPPPRLFTTDTTEEKLFQKLHAHSGAFAVMTAEGRPILDAIQGKYSGGSRTGDAIYLAGISGDTITRDRIGNEKSGPEDLIIMEPCLNVCAMVQPDKFLELNKNTSLKESGLIARILPAAPVSKIGTRFEESNEKELDAARLAGFLASIQSILNAKRPVDPVTAKTLPHIIRLNGDAKEARRQWYNIVEKEMGTGGILVHCRDVAAKMVSQVVKIAMLLHLIDNPALLNMDSSEISLSTWKSAQQIGGYFLDTALRFRNIVEQTSDNVDVKRITEWLYKTGKHRVTVRDVLRDGPRPRFKKTHEVLTVFADLTKLGILAKEDKWDEWMVNPRLFT